VAFTLTRTYSVDVAPNGTLAVELADDGGVLLLSPKEARALASRLRRMVAPETEADLLRERNRLNEALKLLRARERLAAGVT
jgi:hypothetical protein